RGSDIVWVRMPFSNQFLQSFPLNPVLQLCKTSIHQYEHQVVWQEKRSRFLRSPPRSRPGSNCLQTSSMALGIFADLVFNCRGKEQWVRNVQGIRQCRFNASVFAQLKK